MDTNPVTASEIKKRNAELNEKLRADFLTNVVMPTLTRHLLDIQTKENFSAGSTSVYGVPLKEIRDPLRHLEEQNIPSNLTLVERVQKYKHGV